MKEDKLRHENIEANGREIENHYFYLLCFLKEFDFEAVYKKGHNNNKVNKQRGK